MKENELRIGNWVRHCAAWSYRQDADDFEEFNFQWKLEDFYALCECTLDIDNVEYIPLTEEWLLKFGFETSDWDNNSTYRKMIGNNDYTIVFDEYSNTMVGDILIKEIKYVHQLQNLYFALTGEELTYGGNK
jgi:hypothetical protein